MTTPDQELRAMESAEELLTALAIGEVELYGTSLRRTPKAVREIASRILRHYPTKPRLRQLTKESG